MHIDLPGNMEEEIQTLAVQQGRDVHTLVAEALQQYLGAAALADVEADDVAQTQAALFGELPHIPDWKADDA